MMVEAPEQLVAIESPFTRAYRMIPSRYPPVGIFDDLVEPDELDVLFAIEARTNDRLAGELGLLELVAPEDRLVGAGTTPVMAAFTHPSPTGSRFTDGAYGVYYCGDSATVTIDECAYHRARFLRASNEPPCTVEMRLYTGNIQARLHDGLGDILPASVLNPDNYEQSQRWGRSLRDSGAYGLLYPSVRSAGGRCAALLRPPAIGPVLQGAHYHFRFDGQRISHVFQVSNDRKM